MPVTLTVIGIGVVAGGLVALLNRRRPMTDAPENVEDDVVAETSRHPAIVRFIHRIGTRAAASTWVLGALIAAFVLSALVGAALDMVRRDSGFARWDQAVADWGAASATGWSTTLLAAITQLGSSWFALLLVSGVGYVGYRRWRSWDVPLFLATVYAGHSILSNGLKWIIGRERPLVEHLVGTASSSFPSTHAGTAAAMWAATALVLSAGRSRSTRMALGATAVAVAVAVAASRALLGVHWLTDVVAGSALGWAWYLLVAVAFGGRVLRLGEPAERVKAEASR